MLDTKVPKNPKYQNVKSNINTGKSAKDVEIISKFLCLQGLGDMLLAKRKNEKFKRIKCSTLAKLLSEITVEESIYNLNKEEPI